MSPPQVTSICNAQGLVRAEDAQNAQGQARAEVAQGHNDAQGNKERTGARRRRRSEYAAPRSGAQSTPLSIF
jgi:hypothetical protein